MKKSLLFVFVLILILFLPLISAEILLSQPKNLYNLGEILEINIKLTGPIEDVIETNLICNEEKKLFYAEYISLKENKELSLDKILRLKNIKGSCYINAEAGNQTRKTSNFIISDKINLELSLNKENLLSGETIEVTGTAIKENNEKVNGIIEIYLADTFLKESEIKNGGFSIKLNLPQDLAASEYTVTVKAADKEKLNFGEAKKPINILSIPSLIALNLSEAKAGGILTISATLYNQDKKQLEGNIIVVVNSPDTKEFYKGEIASGQTSILDLPSDALMGDWQVKASYNSIETEKHFYMDKNEEVNWTLENDILTVKNIGNTQYKKLISVDLKNETQNFSKLIMVDLDIGETAEFKISALQGEYEIEAANESLGKASLTGSSSIKVEKLSESIVKGPFLAILIGILMLLILVIFSHSGLRKEIRKVGEGFSKEKKYIIAKLDTTEKEKSRIKKLFEEYADKSVADKIIQTPDVAGEKKEVTALFVDIRGFSEMTKTLGEGIIPVLNKYFKVVTDAVYQNKGIVNHIEADEIFALFNAVEKQPDHIVKAVKAARKIMSDLNKLNKESEIKINIGVGINSGKAIVGKIGTDRIMKFTSIGDTINLAQKIEEKARNKIFITKEVNEEIKGLFKTKKLGIANIDSRPIEIYEVEF